MKCGLIKIVSIFIYCFVFASCAKKGGDRLANGIDTSGVIPVPILLNITPIGELNQGSAVTNSHADYIFRSSLKMNFRSYVAVGQNSLGVANPNYPRIKKMSNGSYIMFYHNNSVGARCNYAISRDLETWDARGFIFENYSITDSKGEKNERRFSNCDALVLANGDILAVASFRADKGYREKPLDAGIALRRSRDNGNTWGDPVEIYQGINWEPYLLQLPSGEIHCYFTDSDRTLIVGTDTGTGMVISDDNGNTWNPSFGNFPYYVIRTKHTIAGNTYFTNQMPSVIKLNNSNELAAAVEAHPGDYYISFAYSGEGGEWLHLAADEEGPEDRNDNAFPGSAPYLMQFPSGETILSYNRSNVFHMKIGDARARNFGESYTPFPGRGYWGTLEPIDNHQLIGAMPNTSTGEVMISKFILNHNITATKRSVQVDGDNAEWKNTDEALFVGDKSQAQATLRASVDDDSVYFLVEVLDEFISKFSYATILISPFTDNDVLNDGAYKINMGYDGLRELFIYNGGWTSGDLGATAKSACQGTVSYNIDRDYGYIVELAVPRSKLNIKSGQMLVNFAVTDSEGSEDAVFNTASASTAKWVLLAGL